MKVADTTGTGLGTNVAANGTGVFDDKRCRRHTAPTATATAAATTAAAAATTAAATTAQTGTLRKRGQVYR